MEFDKTFTDELKEERLRIVKIKTGFKNVVNVNYVDSHKQITPFGTRWGRGVVVKDNSGYDTIIGSFSSSHSDLKKSMQPGETTAGTFYFGYDSLTKTMYLEYGSDRTFDFNDRKIIDAIMDGLKNSNTVFKNFII